MKYLLLLVILLSGCGTVERMRDASLTEGCAIVEADAKLGWFNQEGGAEVCKIKCSKEVPDNVYIEYDNVRSGCKIGMRKDGTGT